MTREEAVEVVGECADTIENLMAAASLPLPPSIHLDGLKGSLSELQEKLTMVFLALGGEK